MISPDSKDHLDHYIEPYRSEWDSAAVNTAVDTLCKALRSDESFYYAYQANIAMAFKDEFWRNIHSHADLDLMDVETLHIIANQAAKNFLDLLIKDKPSTSEETPNPGGIFDQTDMD